MPELPEVETWRRLAESEAVGRTIRKVTASRDEIVYDQIPASAFSRALTGKQITAAKRVGKHLWIELEDAPSLYLHFGMSGSLHRHENGQPEPSHAKLKLQFDEGTGLIYRCVRRIGRVRLMQAPDQEPPIQQLGPDPFNEPIIPTDFHQRILKRKSPIKSLLLDQRVLAGIGNWLADDILYAARINPHRHGNAITFAECKRILQQTSRILNKAVEAEADETRFPKTWLFHPRWKRNATHSQRGERLQYDRIGGRSTVWVPDRQR